MGFTQRPSVNNNFDASECPRPQPSLSRRPPRPNRFAATAVPAADRFPAPPPSERPNNITPPLSPSRIMESGSGSSRNTGEPPGVDDFLSSLMRAGSSDQGPRPRSSTCVFCVVKLGGPSASPAPVCGCSARVRREGVRVAGARASPAHRAQDRHATSRLLGRTQPPQRPHCTQPVPNVAAAALRGSYPSHGERLGVLATTHGRMPQPRTPASLAHSAPTCSRSSQRPVWTPSPAPAGLVNFLGCLLPFWKGGCPTIEGGLLRIYGSTITKDRVVPW